MKVLFTTLLLLLATTSFSQLSFPKGFHLVPGENLSGDDDVYTNGKYSFDTHKIFRDYDYKGNDEGVRKYVTDFFGFPFHLTKDSLCWGTGKSNNLYCYIVVTKSAEVIELYSATNDAGFSYYSKWLLDTIRKYEKEGKVAIFPMRMR